MTDPDIRLRCIELAAVLMPEDGIDDVLEGAGRILAFVDKGIEGESSKTPVDLSVRCPGCGCRVDEWHRADCPRLPQPHPAPPAGDSRVRGNDESEDTAPPRPKGRPKSATLMPPDKAKAGEKSGKYHAKDGLKRGAWSTEELDRLQAMWPDAERTIDDICAELGRPKPAVQAKASELGLKRPPGNRGRKKRDHPALKGPKPVPPAGTDDVSQAQLTLQRAGYVVHRAQIAGGRKGMWVVDGREMSEADMIAKADTIARRRSGGGDGV